MKKIHIGKLLGCIALPLFVGGASYFLIRNNINIFDSINKPPLTPPRIVFPIAWTILYLLMGIASYLALDDFKQNKNGFIFYLAQLVFNFFWSIIFFNYKQYLLAYIWIILLWALIVLTFVYFYKQNKTAGILLIPYILWVTFASYLNLAIYLLN